MRALILALLVLFLPLAAAADEEVEVNFDEEEEVVTTERPEIDIEQETSPWLLVFPFLVVGLLAWNVQWRKQK
jgi:hypothetical protein